MIQKRVLTVLGLELLMEATPNRELGLSERVTKDRVLDTRWPL